MVLAAGRGSRFGGRKQFAVLSGLSVLSWSLRAALSVARRVVLVMPSDVLLGDLDLTELGEWVPDVVVAGGDTRADSVRSALREIPSTAEVIVVHDAARPLASADLFGSVVAAVRDGSDGAVPALVVSDTLKRVEGDQVVSTVDRSDVVAVQTPQAFRAEVLRRAHVTANDATDDSGLVEAIGAKVRIVPGDPRNLKITTPADLVFAEALISSSASNAVEGSGLTTGPGGSVNGLVVGEA